MSKGAATSRGASTVESPPLAGFNISSERGRSRPDGSQLGMCQPHRASEQGGRMFLSGRRCRGDAVGLHGNIGPLATKHEENTPARASRATQCNGRRQLHETDSGWGGE